MNRKTLAALAMAAMILAPAPATGAVSAAAIAAIKKIVDTNQKLSKANQELNKQIKGEVDGLHETVEEQLTVLNSAMVLEAELLNAINQTIYKSSMANAGIVGEINTALATEQVNTALKQASYAGRIDHNSEDIAVAVDGCVRGHAARVADSVASMPRTDGRTVTAGQAIGRELAHTVTERRAAGTEDHVKALLSVPHEMKTGDHYGAGAAFTATDVKRLKMMSWLVAPKDPLNRPEEYAADGIRYGLARQVLGHWFAGLAPLGEQHGIASELPARYTAEALPVVWEDGPGGTEANVPAHGLLRAEALNPWFDASPLDPAASYSGWLLSLNHPGLLREQTRLGVINNRLLYEQLIWTRFVALLLAEQDLRS